LIPPFALARPASLEAAFAAFDRAAGDAAWYAGGTELLQVMKMGLARFGTLIDLKGIAELRRIALDDAGNLLVGGAATHREIERSRLVRDAVPAFADLEANVANGRVRNQGTLGGNLCFAEPHSDPATFLLACEATVRLVGPDGDRRLAIDAFVDGPFSTARRPDEILIEVVVPRSAAGEGRAYEKVRFRERPAVSVAVALRVADGTVVAARIAVGSLTDVPLLVPDAAAPLVGVPATEAGLAEPLAAGVAAMGRLDAAADLDGSPDYKRHLAGVLLERAAGRALAEATGRG
jgi:carbon-monoxide dehydrogenase medium subunit